MKRLLGEMGYSFPQIQWWPFGVAWWLLITPCSLPSKIALPAYTKTKAREQITEWCLPQRTSLFKVGSKAANKGTEKWTHILLYLGTTFLGNEGYAIGDRASAHVLVRQAVLAVLVPVLVSFLTSSLRMGGKPPPFCGLSFSKTCDGPKPSKPIVTRKKWAVAKSLMPSVYSYATILIQMTCIMNTSSIKVKRQIITRDHTQLRRGSTCSGSVLLPVLPRKVVCQYSLKMYLNAKTQI